MSQLTLTEFPTLFKRTSKGGTQIWNISVHPQDDGSAIIRTEHGLLDGNLQVATERITEGKNAGKKNATTPIEQAIKQAESAHTKKRERKHYGLTVEESDVKKQLAPMLAHTYQDHKNKVNWDDPANLWIQPKFDGHRCLAVRGQANDITLYSREAKEITTCPHIVEQLLHLLPKGSVFDGELYTHGVPLNKISSYVKKQRPESENLSLIVYDTLITQSPFADRIQHLMECMPVNADNVHLSRTTQVSSLDDAYRFQADCLTHGYEGSMLRHGTTGYEPGKRSHGLLKMKTFEDAEFKIVGVRQGKGSYEGAAVFQCETDNGNPFEVTSPGSIPEKKAIWDNKDSYIGKKVTVKYQGFTATDNPVPFIPVAKNVVE